MHSVVMQNKKYMKFAAANTVEVLSLSGLDDAVKKEEKRAGTYKKKNKAGEVVEYMVEWPSLTYKQIMALRSSKAGRYNDTGKIPYTCLVNPHDLSKMKVFKGASAGSIMDEVEIARKALKKEHGKGIKRKVIAKINSGLTTSAATSAKHDFDGALKAIDKVAPKPQNLPQMLQDKVKAAKDAVMASARTRLDAIKSMDAKEAKKQISRFMSKAKKTGLADEAREFLMSLKEG